MSSSSPFSPWAWRAAAYTFPTARLSRIVPPRPALITCMPARSGASTTVDHSCALKSALVAMGPAYPVGPSAIRARNDDGPGMRAGPVSVGPRLRGGSSKALRGLRLDERLDRGQHLVLGQRLVERVGRRGRRVAQPDDRGVTRLDLDDRAG